MPYPSKDVARFEVLMDFEGRCFSRHSEAELSYGHWRLTKRHRGDTIDINVSMTFGPEFASIGWIFPSKVPFL